MFCIEGRSHFWTDLFIDVSQLFDREDVHHLAMGIGKSSNTVIRCTCKPDAVFNSSELGYGKMLEMTRFSLCPHIIGYVDNKICTIFHVLSYEITIRSFPADDNSEFEVFIIEYGVLCTR